VRNLEVKARDPEPAATVRACLALGAHDHGVLRQRDTYFRVPSGRLKLREDLDSGSAELIAYERPDTEGVRESRYERVPVDPALGALLAQALGVAGVVEKTRRLFLHEHVRIHLDEVEGLGSFVELEAVLPTASGESLERVAVALSFDRREPVTGSYLDLLAWGQAP
jgi:adenylate cyclase class IV